MDIAELEDTRNVRIVSILEKTESCNMGYKTLQLLQPEGFDACFKVIARKHRGCMRICLFYDRRYKRKDFTLYRFLMNNHKMPLFSTDNTVWIS